MIFTRRFGALAARPNFRETEEHSVEQELELLVEEAAQRGDDTPRTPADVH